MIDWTQCAQQQTKSALALRSAVFLMFGPCLAVALKRDQDKGLIGYFTNRLLPRKPRPARAEPNRYRLPGTGTVSGVGIQLVKSVSVADGSVSTPLLLARITRLAGGGSGLVTVPSRAIKSPHTGSCRLSKVTLATLNFNP